MQRTKENVERDLNEQNDSKLLDQELVDLCRKEGDRYMTTNSFLYCESLRYGRVSYKGMNPEIEKLMESKRIAPPTKSSTDDPTEADISNDEMAKAFKKFKPNKKP